MPSAYQIEKKEYNLLSLEQKTLLDRVSDFEPIRTLIHEISYSNVRLNFKTSEQNGKLHFEFDICEPTSSKTLYNVKGHLVNIRNSKNVVYTIKDCRSVKRKITYLQRRTEIDEDVYLNESLKVKSSFCDVDIDRVYIDLGPNARMDILAEIFPDDKLYKKYLNGEITLDDFYESFLISRHHTRSSIKKERTPLSIKLTVSR